MAIKDKNLQKFGMLLKEARIKVGFTSLSKAIDELKNRTGTTPFSKATLNLLENGRISEIKPDFLKIICECYGVSYEVVLSEFIKAKYDIPDRFPLFHSDFIKKSDDESFTLRPTYMNECDIEILSLDTLKKIQSSVPDRSTIGVSANTFLDDKVYFDMVLSNLKRGVRYYYYLPKDCEHGYRKFIADISKQLSTPVNRVDQRLCYFIPRGIAEFPINNVIHIHPDNSIYGFVGIVASDMVQYYQQADALLNWRIYQSFLMAISLSLDDKIQHRRIQIAHELKNQSEIKGFPILMDDFGI
jgi:transcriptional regulator with XRE-family HTH domain